ncbi:hypothetical protein KIW84_050416 [Lathyrus oleraceus]|uniref:Myosin motor domain-containing protein n=1 Tax=Pisum sativum TaxID=3888 RepID=A0A9D5ACE1_PEA|nr:hypothetical protein KIW84_050416 [Pisum sativum]
MQHVFKMEQEEYTKEEIDWSYIEFVDNQDVLDLIEKKPGGVIALLDEACMFPRSTHETFAEKYQTLKDNKRFSKPKLSRTDFTINHYAGLFPPLHEESTKSTKFSSIATQFKQQLQSLLETLSATESHYIRCVKPNNLLKSGIFENNDVLQQLRCGGVMEAIRISCAGYPTRKNFDEFVQRFSIMEPKVLKSCPDEMTACKRLLDKANLKDYQIGKTKVFLRAGQMAELDACRVEVLGRSAIVIQKKARTYIYEKQYKLLRFYAIELQRAIKARKSFRNSKRHLVNKAHHKKKWEGHVTIVEVVRNKRIECIFDHWEISPNVSSFNALLSDDSIRKDRAVSSTFAPSLSIEDSTFLVLASSEVEVITLNKEEARPYIRTYRSVFGRDPSDVKIRNHLQLRT